MDNTQAYIKKSTSIQLSLLSYGIALFLLYLQIPFNGEESIPPHGWVLLRQLLSNPSAAWDILQFCIAVMLIHIAPITFILALYKRVPSVLHYSTFRIILTGVGYTLLWHISIAFINAMLIPRSDWAVGIVYNSNTVLNLSVIIGSNIILLSLFFKAMRGRINYRAAGLVVSVLCLSFFLHRSNTIVQANNHSDKPNIFIIGVDSFSINQYEAYKDYLPNIRKIMEDSVQFVDTVTPLGRTFTAWTSILSGKYPRETGARDNLFPLNRIDTSDFLSKKLQSAGYTTLLAMDDRQFSNIDNSWGFDKVIGPNVGVADFVLSSLSDIPAINISISAFPAVSEIIFPFTTYNRAAWKSYLPKRFSDKLDRELAQDFDSPIFLAVHFCIAHTPYKWGNITPPPKLDFSPIGTNWHYKAIKAADDQVGQLIDTLGKSGRLKNAIIVLLSDHGEGLGFQTRTFTAESNIPPAGENPYDFKTLEFSFGHGSNLNEPNINQAVLGINRYIDSKPIAPHSKQTTPATLIDIMPTILELTAIDTESQKSLSGISLAPFLSNPKEPLPDRFRFLETGLSTFALNTRSPSHTDLLNTMSEFFTINSSGRLELILDRYPSVMRKKTLAVIHGKWQLTMYPFNELGIRQLLFNRESGEWTDKTESSLWTEANGQQLKEKLIGFFGVDGMEALDPELHLIHLKSRI